MNNVLSKRSGVILLLMLVAGCSTNTGPVEIRESGSVSHAPVVSSESTPVQSSHASPTPPVQPVFMDSPLKRNLLEESQKRLSENEPKAAIVLAERGLRVDRKEPRFYQVLASAYAALSNQTQSVYFAKQGLRYAQKGSEIYQSLLQWLP